MKKYSGFLFIFYCLLVKFNVVFGAETCMTSKDCSDLQYCSSFGKICEPCTNICDKSSHNYDENRCEQDCKRYLQHLANDNSPVLEEIKTLRTLVSVSLALNCIIIFFLIFVAVYKYMNWKTKGGVSISWLRNKLKTKEKSKSDRPTTVSVTASSGKPDLRLDMPPLGIQTPSPNGNTPSTATTTLTISRRPTEDNTLDYAYDNPAMTSSSPKPHESSL